MLPRLAGFLLVAGSLLVARPASAQGNYRLSAVSGRTTLVGGTGLVYGHDSASAFLNPATAQLVDKNRLAFSVQAYQFSYMTSGNWYQPGPIDTKTFGNVKREGTTSIKGFDIDSLPGSLCIFFGFKDIPFLAGSMKESLREKGARLGFCIATTSYGNFSTNNEDYTQATSAGVTRQAVNVRQTFRRVSIGPTYSMYVNNALSLGASVHISRADHRSLFGATSTTYTSDGSVPINSNFYSFARGYSHDMTATLGATYRIGAHQTVALVLESPSVHFFGSGGVNESSQYTGPTAAGRTFSSNGSFVTRTPARVALGTGIQRDWGSVELNTSLWFHENAAYSAQFDGNAITTTPNGPTLDQSTRNHFTAPALGAVNIGVGGEYFFSPRSSVLAGISNDATIVPKGTIQNDPLHFFPSRTHRGAISIGYGSHGEGGDLLIGGELSYAWGDHLAPNVYQLPAQLDATSTQTFGFLIVLAGSTSFRNIRRVADDVKSMVTPGQPDQPTRSPANVPKTPLPGKN